MNAIEQAIKASREREAKATAGPWKREDGTLLVWSHCDSDRPGKPITKGESSNSGGFQMGLYKDFEPRDNCDFIAASRTFEPRFRDALEYLIGEVQKSCSHDLSVWADELKQVERILAGQGEG